MHYSSDLRRSEVECEYSQKKWGRNSHDWSGNTAGHSWVIEWLHLEQTLLFLICERNEAISNSLHHFNNSKREWCLTDVNGFLLAARLNMLRAEDGWPSLLGSALVSTFGHLTWILLRGWKTVLTRSRRSYTLKSFPSSIDGLNMTRMEHRQPSAGICFPLMHSLRWGVVRSQFSYADLHDKS
jgi:hypothetical protein